MNKQILLTLLEGDGSARQIVNTNVLTYVESTLTQEDQEVCKYYMNGQLIKLMAMSPDNVKVARQAVPDLLKMIHNTNEKIKLRNHLTLFVLLATK